MLLTSMDIDPSDEAEFNRWYDRNLEERVAIDGFSRRGAMSRIRPRRNISALLHRILRRARQFRPIATH